MSSLWGNHDRDINSDKKEEGKRLKDSLKALGIWTYVNKMLWT